MVQRRGEQKKSDIAASKQDKETQTQSATFRTMETQGNYDQITFVNVDGSQSDEIEESTVTTKKGSKIRKGQMVTASEEGLKSAENETPIATNIYNAKHSEVGKDKIAFADVESEQSEANEEQTTPGPPTSEILQSC